RMPVSLGAHMTKPKLLFGIWLLLSAIAFSQASSNADAEISRGQTALAARDYRAAFEAFKAGNKKQDGKCAPCYLGMGIAYMRTGNAHDALEACDKAAKFALNDHTRGQAHNLKAAILNALAEDDKKKLSESLNEYKTAISFDSGVPLYHFNYGVALLKAEQTKEGVEELEKYLSLEPEGT